MTTIEPSVYRRRMEAVIWVIDIVGYLAVVGMGIYATFFSPGSVTTFLKGWEWVVPIWCTFLLFGGLVGAVGRVSRLGLIEIPANTSAIFGVAIYLIVIQGLALQEPTAGVAAFAMIVVTGAILRRGVELQIYYSNPGVKMGFWEWFEAARTRKTTNYVQRYWD